MTGMTSKPFTVTENTPFRFHLETIFAMTLHVQAKLRKDPTAKPDCGLAALHIVVPKELI